MRAADDHSERIVELVAGSARELAQGIELLPAELDFLGFDPIAGTGAELGAIIDRDLPVWRDVVEKSGAKAE